MNALSDLLQVASDLRALGHDQTANRIDAAVRKLEEQATTVAAPELADDITGQYPLCVRFAAYGSFGNGPEFLIIEAKRFVKKPFTRRMGLFARDLIDSACTNFFRWIE